jgi:hypothetical protein
VDGAETNVVSGAVKTLKNKIMKEILIEIAESDTHAKTLISDIINMGYHLTDIQYINEVIGIPIAEVKNYLFKK